MRIKIEKKINSKKSMVTASFPNCKSLKPTGSLALYCKWRVITDLFLRTYYNIENKKWQ